MKKTHFCHNRLWLFSWYTMEGRDAFEMHITKEFSIEFRRIRNGLALPLYIRWVKRNEVFSKEHRLLVGFLFWNVAFTRIKFETDVEVIY